MNACRNLLPGGRWHFQHGPIDLVLQVDGEPLAVARAHERAWQRFDGLLQELVAELAALRAPVGADCPLHGAVARRMWAACAPFRAGFITPMAAVAGAVAQEILDACGREGIDRAWVNNGGDIALYLAPGRSVTVGVYADVSALNAVLGTGGLALDGTVHIDSTLPVRGVATSGWRGRSQSLGIADSVTVLAATAAQADAAATVVANAVNVQDVRVRRAPAWQVRDDSDLGDRLVTMDVPALPSDIVHAALRAGWQKAQELQADGLLWGALLVCQGQSMATASAQAVLGAPAPPEGAEESVVGSVFA
ncbi:MAG: UPF0280 family protein [Acidovorax sp.]|uniref:UPF0280 family protein n=1 Tax=Acidovorax sp. TaxID=1872122 RepID=UPI0025BF686D|nr:UPF0280 family protein [Acidovorax sp.]MCE1193850.1 UPF0280 family protein [Acidovorax sp.]